MTSFDISLYGEGLLFEVDWDRNGTFGHPLSDVTKHWVSCAYEYGTARRSNPERPTIQAGRGNLTLIGDEFIPGRSAVFDQSDLNRRRRMRVSLNSTRLFEAYMAEVIHDQNASRAISRFRLEGYLERPGREQVIISQPSTTSTTVSDEVIALLRDVYGLDAASLSHGLQATPLTRYSFKGAAAQYLSEFARVASGLPCALRSGALRLQDVSVHPATVPIFRNADYAIEQAATDFDIEQIWNSITATYRSDTQFSDARTHTFVSAATRVGNTISQSWTVPLGALGMGETRDSVELTDVLPVKSPPSSGSNVDITYGGDPPPVATTLTVNGDQATIAATFELGGIYLLPVWRRVGTLFRQVRFRGSGFVRTDVLIWRTNFNSFDWVTEGGGASGDARPFNLEYTLRWVVSGEPAMIEVRNDESIIEWGERKLSGFPAWVSPSAAGRVQAVIDASAVPRNLFPVSFAISQPDAAKTVEVAEIEAGDHIGLSIADPSRRIAINAIAFVMSVGYVLDRNRDLRKDLLCLESGGGQAHAGVTLSINDRPLSFNGVELGFG